MGRVWLCDDTTLTFAPVEIFLGRPIVFIGAVSNYARVLALQDLFLRIGGKPAIVSRDDMSRDPLRAQVGFRLVARRRTASQLAGPISSCSLGAG